ncbi:hypothetical protein EDD18DRAFT_1400063 [Armillaria luteobubalina]|uniref:Uncharacterized protein n=1 Tax=Armillaria luteobubalina TaxID=153913 RepID=A0AA39QPN3_9AGAR|nr:hypothetical protein EDD18DRAFT_1400063 [Armillaria luteobubalina]
MSQRDLQRMPVQPFPAGNGSHQSRHELEPCVALALVDPALKANTIDVLTFHSSFRYRIQAPEPFGNDGHEDLHGDLARITPPNSTFILTPSGRLDIALHIIPPRASRASFRPTSARHVCITPEAFFIASAEFGQEIEYW